MEISGEEFEQMMKKARRKASPRARKLEPADPSPAQTTHQQTSHPRWVVGFAALVCRKGLSDDGQTSRHEHRGADALYRAGGDQVQRTGSDAAPDRRCGENNHARVEYPRAAEVIAGLQITDHSFHSRSASGLGAQPRPVADRPAEKLPH